MTSALHLLAARHGISCSYWGLDGTPYTVPDGTLSAILGAMGVAAGDEAAAAASLLQAPELPEALLRAPASTRCFLPGWLEEKPAWGIALQVYALRSRRNWGIGDFSDVAEIGILAAQRGADFLGTNPLHAGFIAEPNRRSPFFPSSRHFLNILYIALDWLPGFADALADPTELGKARSGDLVDYELVAKLKLSALRELWESWKASPPADAPYSASGFAAFCDKEGEALRRHALFETLSLFMIGEGRTGGWSSWPAAFQDCDSPEVAAFATQWSDEIRFHSWLQWLAGTQLQQVQHTLKTAGMRIGLYLDFAVGEAPDGSATWSAPSEALRGVEMGAPPDYFSVKGQNWGLAPLSPIPLKSDVSVFRRLLSATMRYAGALRLDHVMGLWQLFLIPEGRTPADGTYVRYPLQDLLTALADLSHRHQTIMIGEDLGNVPEGFREAMAEAMVLSYRILYFEKIGDQFIPPVDFPKRALACLSTHDLPTLHGWWSGADIELRRRYGLLGDEAAVTLHAYRAAERQELLGAMLRAGAFDAPFGRSATSFATPPDEVTAEELVIAVHRHLARAPSHLLAVRLEDLLGERDPVNLPGTVDDYPNWRIKLASNIEALADAALFQAVTAMLAKERPQEGS